MGVTALPKVVEILLAAGLAPDTPSAVIQSGTTSAQRVVRSPVEALPRAVEEAGIKPPGLFVIGPTLGHADRLDWFGQRPLCGHRLLLVSPAGSLGEELELAGAEVVEVPLPVTPAARVVMDALPLTGCILRNPEEVDALDEERDGPGFGPDVVAWCLDAVTASRALEVGWKSAEVVERAEVVDSVARGRG